MNTIVRGITAVIAGILFGGVVNMGLIISGGEIIPAPAGVDVSDTASIAASMHLFEARHFVFPFLAHAVGTLVGAVTAALIAASHKTRFALGIGAVYLCGGIASTFMIPAPAWFIALDLVVAYLPMGWLGGVIAMRAGDPTGKGDV